MNDINKELINKFVCADCSHEQDSMDRKCDKCSSIRVVLISMAKQFFGADWRDNFKEIKNK
jgi:predicted ATP-dependent serine protease